MTSNRLTLLVSRAGSYQAKATTTIDIGIRGKSEATAFSRKTVTSNWMCLLPLGCPHFPVMELWYASHSNGDQRTVKKRPFGFLSSHVGKCVVCRQLSDCSIFLSQMDFSNNFTIRTLTDWLLLSPARWTNQPTNHPMTTRENYAETEWVPKWKKVCDRKNAIPLGVVVGTGNTQSGCFLTWMERYVIYKPLILVWGTSEHHIFHILNIFTTQFFSEKKPI